MSKLEELINELCPNGVDYIPLKDVSDVKRGERITKKDLKDDGLYPVMSGGTSYFGRYDKYNRNEDTITVAQYGSAGYVSFIKEKFWANDVCYSIIPKNIIDNKFLYYCLSNQQNYIFGLTTKAVPDCLPKDRLESIQIPIPSPQVQEEIVRILDNFTELTAELTAKLTAELNARKQQYEYYSESLLNFKEEYDCKKIKLKEICDIYLGLTATPKYMNSGVKFISAQNTSKDFLDLENVKYISEIDYAKATSNAKPKRGDILFTRVGSNLGHPVIIDTDEKLCIFVSLGFLRIKNKNIVSNSYLKHWMNTDLFWSQVRKKVFGAAKVNLNTGWLKEFELTLPPIDIQEKIVNHLDCFEKHFNFLHDDLSLEIEARQKQYEYYRDKLLTFKKKEAAENE